MYVYRSVCGYMNVRAASPKDQKKALDPRELELKVAVSHLRWVLRIDLLFPAMTTKHS